MPIDIVKIFALIVSALPWMIMLFGWVALIVFILPQTALEWLGLADQAQEHRHIFGLFFLCGMLLTLARGVKWIGETLQYRQQRRPFFQRLERLTEEEKKILRFYIVNQTRTNDLRFYDGVVRGLEHMGIIQRAASVADINGVMAFNISNEAWEYLNKKQTLLCGTTLDMRRDKSPFLEELQRKWR